MVGGSVSSHEVIYEILPFAQHSVIAWLQSGPAPFYGIAPFDHPHIQIAKQITPFCSLIGNIALADSSIICDVDHAWEDERVARLKGGKDYYSVVPHYKDYYEFLRCVVGDPAPGTTVLPPLNNNWLDVRAAAPGIKLKDGRG